MRIKMVCLEDGITSCGFRKMAAFVAQREPGSESLYVSTNQFKNLPNLIRGKLGMPGQLDDDGVDEIAQDLAAADLVGFSSMTGYADLTRRIIKRVREIDPSTYMIWGGIHPIIHPDDAIQADVDAICTGEGEFAFDEFYSLMLEGRDYKAVKNFWFKEADGTVVRNDFLPLMTPDEMGTLPFPEYGAKREKMYRNGQGFVPLTQTDYLMNFSLSYQTVWSLGCPFHCSFCGNTKFIANDPKYKRVRHPSPRYLIEEIKSVKATFPFVNHVSFHDDSFMAIPYREIEEFAELWHDELGMPFMVYGVIPNYVKKEKFDILTWAGMNRIRMGIQSGSQDILDFYKRPTPPARIKEAADVIGSYVGKYHIPPAYDIIVDNPIETRQDVVDTLEFLYELPRPYTPYVYSLKIIPNTELEKAFTERGIELDGISETFMIVPPRWGNLMIYVVQLWRPPRWLFDRLLKGVKASSEPQKMYPRTGTVLRALTLAKRAIGHFKFLDFSILPGRSGYFLWRTGVLGFLKRHFSRHAPRPEVHTYKRSEVGARIPVVEEAS